MHCFHFSDHPFAGRDGLGEANVTKYPEPNAATIQAANLWASAHLSNLVIHLKFWFLYTTSIYGPGCLKAPQVSAFVCEIYYTNQVSAMEIPNNLDIRY